MVNDPLGDMLTRIRNAQMRRQTKVVTPASNLRARVLDVLADEGYIRGYTRVERGGKALLSEMERWPEVGSVAGVGSVGFSVRYAWHQVAADGTERVTMITPRPMSFSERWNSGRSTDYPFLIVQMELQPDGKGTGSIIIAAQLFADKVNKSLVVDTLLDQPILLQGLERLQ